MRIAFRTEFNCPADQLWNYMVDSDNLPQWVPECREFRLTKETPDMVGSTYEVDTRRGKKTVTCYGTTLEWEPNRRLKESVTGGGIKQGTAMVSTYDIADHGDRCTMDYAMEWDGRGFFMTILYHTMGKMYCKSMIKRLKRHAEASA